MRNHRTIAICILAVLISASTAAAQSRFARSTRYTELNSAKHHTEMVVGDPCCGANGFHGCGGCCNILGRVVTGIADAIDCLLPCGSCCEPLARPHFRPRPRLSLFHRTGCGCKSGYMWEDVHGTEVGDAEMNAEQPEPMDDQEQDALYYRPLRRGVPLPARRQTSRLIRPASATKAVPSTERRKSVPSSARQQTTAAPRQLPTTAAKAMHSAVKSAVMPASAKRSGGRTVPSNPLRR